jgi:hypothetical protein
MRLSDFAERLVEPAQIRLAGYEGALVYLSQLQPCARLDFKPVTRPSGRETGGSRAETMPGPTTPPVPALKPTTELARNQSPVTDHGARCTTGVRFGGRLGMALRGWVVAKVV